MKMILMMLALLLTMYLVLQQLAHNKIDGEPGESEVIIQQMDKAHDVERILQEGLDRRLDDSAAK